MHAVAPKMILGSPQRTEVVVTPNKIGPYRLGQVINSGSFAVVKLATHEPTDEKYACKIVPKRKLVQNPLESNFEKEIRILKRLRHPGIATINDLFKDSINYYIIMELVEGGSLYDMIRSGPIPERKCKLLFKQILQIIQYVHSKGVSHRDIKPENILLTDDSRVKLIDFGLSSISTPGDLLSTMCGTLAYTCPEVLEGKAYRGAEADMWSLGVTLYTMIFGGLPWAGVSRARIVNEIVEGYYCIPTTCSVEARDLIRGLLQTKPEMRLTVEDALKSPWFKDTADLEIPKEVDPCPLTDEYLDVFFEHRPNDYKRKSNSLTDLTKKFPAFENTFLGLSSPKRGILQKTMLHFPTYIKVKQKAE